MDIIASLQWRYATKKFNPKALLSQEVIDQLSEAFRLSAVSYGLQPVRMLVIQNKKKQEAIKPMAMHQPQVADCSHLLVLCIERSMNKTFIKEHFERVQKLRNTSKELLEPFEQFLSHHFAQKSEEEYQQWARNQIYLIMGKLLAACALLKVDACPMEGFDPEQLDEFLGLEALNLKSVLLLPVGKRAEDDIFADLPKVRRTQEELIIKM
ncbi:MAG: NAD(P)H-dependent oxidoreductase [Flavobacteriaceae bacterium]|nr:NAD(P)H-dependent oxidoreductase [Flavobacteriaceae bacterium]